MSIRRSQQPGGTAVAGERIALRRTQREAQERIVLRRRGGDGGGAGTDANLRLRRRGWKDKILDWRRWHRHPRALAACAALVLLVAGVPGYLYYQYYQQWQLEQRHLHAQQFWGLGHKALNDGKAQQAVVEYGRAIELWPEFAPAYVSRGNAWVTLADKTKALADYERALRIDPNLADAYRSRGIVHETTGAPELAERDYRKLVELKPDEPYYFNRLMAVLYEQDKKGDAERQARRTFEQDRKREWAMEAWLGAVLAQRGAGDLLAQVRALEQAGVSGGSLAYYRGSALLGLKRYGEAIEPLQEALKGDPAKTPTGVAVALAQAYRDSGNREACRTTLKNYWQRMGRPADDLSYCDQRGEN